MCSSDLGAFSHLCGNIELFSSIVDIPPVSILSVNGESFLVNQKGTILLTIQSNMPDANIPDMPITLMNIIYVPKLNANLLLVGQMTNANVDVNFSKNHSYLSMDGEILAYGPKISNLFTYTTISALAISLQMISWSGNGVTSLTMLSFCSHKLKIVCSLPFFFGMQSIGTA